MITCQNCGVELPPDASFCPKCGSRVGEPDGKCYREMMRDIRETRLARTGRSQKLGLLRMIIAGLLLVYVTAILYLATSGFTGLVERSNVWAYLLAGLAAYLAARLIVRYLMKC